MSDNKEKKSGFFGWFGKKKHSESGDSEQIDGNASQSADKQPVEEVVDDEQNPNQQAIDKHEIDALVTDIQVTDAKSVETHIIEHKETHLQSESFVESAQVAVDETNEQQANEPEQEKTSFFQRLKSGLSKTRTQFSDGLANLVLGQKEIDDDILEEVETILLMADVGVDTTNQIIDDLTDKANRKQLKDTEALMARLKDLLFEIVHPVQSPLTIPKQDKPFVILMVGVNGVGKTTTIGKLAHQLIAQGRSVMLAAGDTFRAAAVEQLTTWGERNNVPVIAQHTGADSASVIFDAVEAATARNIDVVIADTAGRLHNKSNLMDELSKVKRVMGKVDSEAPHEIMLVVDACTGQNALVQAIEFDKVVSLDSVTITKLDGTAKGGVVFALADKMKLPIRYIGVGEAKEDLRHFDAKDFIDALFQK